jgi:hypothetical protein
MMAADCMCGLCRAATQLDAGGTVRCDGAALASLIAGGVLAGRPVHVTIGHDDACTPSRCGCSPTYWVEPLTETSFDEGQQREREWLAKVAS